MQEKETRNSTVLVLPSWAVGIIVSTLVVLLLNGLAATWWAANLTAQVNAHTKLIEGPPSLVERLIRMEQHFLLRMPPSGG